MSERTDLIRRPAEVFHPIELVIDEAMARGWTIWDVAERMGGDRGAPFNVLQLQLYSVRHADCYMGDGEDFERAFGIDADFWLALEAYWRDHPEAHSEMDDEDGSRLAWLEMDDDEDAPAPSSGTGEGEDE